MNYCDECKFYKWYYDYCEKWQCKIDPREVHNCFEKYDTPILDMMVKGVDRGLTQIKCEVNFYWRSVIDEDEYDSFDDAWKAYTTCVEDKINKLKTRADNCLPENYYINYEVRLCDE